MSSDRFIVEVEAAKEAKDGKPSVGPVYRSVFDKDGPSPQDDAVVSCWDIFRVSVEKYPNNKMLGTRELKDGKHGTYIWMTYKQVYDIVIILGNAIRSIGIKQGSPCGIYGANCTGWIITMEACNAHGLFCVPLYDTLGAGAIEFIICHAEVEIAFVEEKKIPELMMTLSVAKKYLKTIVSFGKVSPQQKEEAEKFGVNIYSWDEFLSLGKDKHFDLPEKKRSDICTIMYTSGTTGDPKGVILTNNSIVTMGDSVKRLLQNVDESLNAEDVYLSYLPLAHIFDRVVEESFIHHGASIGFWRGDVRLILEDLAELKPTIFCAVPRVLERIHAGLQQKIEAGGFLKGTLFNFAYAFKLGNMKKGRKHSEAATMFDRVVFSKIKEGLGGKVRIILSGAAPLASYVEEFLRVVSCSHVLQGYGLTETCAGSFVSFPDNMEMLGTVGPPTPTVEVCLKSIPEMGYDALSSTPRGEVCIRGNTLFSGYFKREDLTKDVMVDGWFHTGDVGAWQPNGSLKIIDRKKNIFKLSQGEYVAVENLENVYSLSPVIDSIWVYGNSFQSYLVAIVNLNKQAIERWAEESEIAGDFDSLCVNPNVKEYILQELFKTGKQKKFKGFELIKDLHIDPVPFDLERDLLTPTYKKKRPQMLKYYQSVIDEMYKITK